MSNGDVKAAAANWLFAQPVPTVLLVGVISYFGWYLQAEVPSHIDRVCGSYERASAEARKAYREAISVTRQSYEDDQQRDAIQTKALMDELFKRRAGQGPGPNPKIPNGIQNARK